MTHEFTRYLSVLIPMLEGKMLKNYLVHESKGKSDLQFRNTDFLPNSICALLRTMDVFLKSCLKNEFFESNSIF